MPTTGMITFDPEAGFAGNPTPLTYTITETATGLTSNASSETVTYQCLPTPNPDVTSTNIDTPVTIPVLINDSFGPDGPSTSPVTVTTQATHGTATVLDNGTPKTTLPMIKLYTRPIQVILVQM